MFQQAIGISKGLDPFPFLRSYFATILSTYGLMNLKNEDYQSLAICNVLRFINYVTSLSDCEDFDGNFHDIHHQNWN